MNMPSEQSVLLNKKEYTEHELEKLKRLTALLYNDNARLLQENMDLRLKQFARFNEEECWIWQGDGSDHLESLVCPVVISAKDLQKIIRRRVKTARPRYI